VVLPLFHCNALFMQLLPVLLSGATAVVGDRFSASGYLDTVRRHRITWANLTAGAVRSVLAQPPRPDDGDQPLRMLTFGLPLHADEIAEVQRRFGIPSLMAYGLTESCAGGVRTPLHTDPRSGWQELGIAQAGWEIAVADARDAPLPAGEVGQILLRGPGLMDRYWRRPDESAAALRGGWLHTGDLGTLDADGHLVFHSREKDMLKPKGENVAASEIEEALDRHPAVLESAVVGVHDPHHEERIVAFLTAAGTATASADALAAHCHGRPARP
jgi:crotonobetaine/carnitine-CoA ligase